MCTSCPSRRSHAARPASLPTTRTRPALLALAALLLGGDALHAQDRSWPPQYRRDRPQLAVEAAGSLAQLRGDALGSATDGTGFDLMVSVGVSVLSLGGGYQRASHRLGGSDASVQGVFFEPRVALPLAARNVTPFAYGRVARLERRTVAANGNDLASGTGLGAGLGTYVWLAPHMQLSTTVGWNAMRFGDGDNTVGAPITGRTNGNAWNVRAGITLGFDRWAR
jgi:hypothetical protein